MTTQGTEHRRPSDWLRLALPVVFVGIVVLVAWRLGYFKLRDPQKLHQAADAADDSPWFVPAFVGVYGVIAALAFPMTLFAYTAGAIFGFIKGGIIVWIGSILGGAGGYWLARTILGGPAERMLGDRKREFASAMHGKVFLNVLRMQLIPFRPFGLVNYAAGVIETPFFRFIAGTAIGVIPGTIATVFVGDQIGHGIRGNHQAYWIAAAVAIGMILLTFIPALIARARAR